MECPICTFEFDSDKRKPLLCKCGNSMCCECVNLLVTKYNNTYTCPFCKFTKNSYKSNPLPENKTIEKLMLKLDNLRYPFKEKISLTDPLIYKDSECQSSSFTTPAEFNAFVTITGIFTFFLLFSPWIFLSMIGISSTMFSCGKFIINWMCFSLICLIVLSILWFINSGNCIITETFNKRFVMLSMMLVALFLSSFYGICWSLDHQECYTDYPAGFIAIIGMCVTGFVVFGLLIIECTARIVLRVKDEVRFYVFSQYYRTNLLVALVYYVGIYGVFNLVIYASPVKVEYGVEKAWLGAYGLAQVFVLWTAVVPFKNYDSQALTILNYLFSCSLFQSALTVFATVLSLYGFQIFEILSGAGILLSVIVLIILTSTVLILTFSEDTH